jgi:hypothetical protein
LGTTPLTSLSQLPARPAGHRVKPLPRMTGMGGTLLLDCYTEQRLELEGKMNRHFTEVALTRLLSGPPNDAETARAIEHLAKCHRCWGKAAECLAQLKLVGSAKRGATDTHGALIALIEERTNGAIESSRARGWWAEIRELSPTEQVRKIRSVSALQRLAVFEVIIEEARVNGRSDPFVGESTARVAITVAELLPEPQYTRELKSDLRGEAMTIVANCRRIAADWPGSAEALEIARRHLAAGTGDPGLEGNFLSIQSSYCTDIGNLEEALAFAKRAVAVFRELEDWQGVAHNSIVEAGCLIAANKPAEAVEAAKNALQRSPAHELRLQVLARFYIVEGLVMLERPLEALQWFKATEPMFANVDTGTRMRVPYFEARLLDALNYSRESEKLFRSAVKTYFEHELYKEAFTTLLTLFESLCRRGALRKAAALCEAAIAATSEAGPACNEQIRRAWEELHAAIRVRQLSDSELDQARQYLIRNWSVPKSGGLVLVRLEATAVAMVSAAPELPAPPPLPPAEELRGGGYKAALDAYDRELIAAALKECGGSIKATVRYLGVSRNGLRDKVRKYGLAGRVSLTEE